MKEQSNRVDKLNACTLAASTLCHPVCKPEIECLTGFLAAMVHHTGGGEEATRQAEHTAFLAEGGCPTLFCSDRSKHYLQPSCKVNVAAASCLCELP